MANTTEKKKDVKKPDSSGSSKKASGKSGTQKPSPEKETVKSSAGKQKAAIVICAAAVFLAFASFIEGESAWQSLHFGLFGIFGFCAYIVPLILFYIAFVLAKEKSVNGAAANILSVSVLSVLISSVIHIFVHSKEYFMTSEIGVQVSDAWEAAFNGSPLANGGIIGAIVGGFLGKYFGKTGAAITFIILIVLGIMLVTGTTLRSVYSAVRKPIKKVSDITNERIERNNERREERAREEAEKAKEEAEKRMAEEKAEAEAAKEKKRFNPPQQPSNNSERFEDQFVTDETTFTPAEQSAESEPDSHIDDDIAAQVEAAVYGVMSVEPENKKPQSVPRFGPSAPDGDPIGPPSAHKPEPVEEIIPEIVEPVESAEPESPEDEEPETVDENEFEAPSVEPSQEIRNYVFPSIELLNKPQHDGNIDHMAEMQMGAKKLISTLDSFKIKAEITNICRGPAVTRYELVPEAGVRISKITSLSEDLALHLAAKSIRIEAPIPGKSAIGIEVPNDATSMVTMREIIDTPQFSESNSKLNVALGKDITGNIICADLAKMPHLLVAGTTGSGKSVCLNSMIVSILYNATPEEVKLLMIDPKMVEFTVYNGIAHLEVPVVSQPRKAAGALSWAVAEMERRYQLFADNTVRDIKGYNRLAESTEDMAKLHHIVIFIDELADLMMTSPKEVEDSICRLAQKARAAGIHLVIATQRPSVDVITGIIKANIPSRIALFVSSQVDSRTILDASGAEKLLGNGDMLFSPVGSSKPTRVQGCFISDREVERIVDHIKNQAQTTYNEETIKEIETKAAAVENAGKKDEPDEDDGDWDPVLNDAAEVVISAGGASTTMLQKKLKLGYARASRVMDQLEEKGIVGPSEGAKPRKVLVSKQQWYEMQALADGAGEGSPNIDDIFADDDESDDDAFDF